MKIALLYFSESDQPIDYWPLGQSLQIPKNPLALSNFLRSNSTNISADFVLFWNPLIGKPDPAMIQEVALLPGDVWHAGLCLGTSGLPHMIDFVSPTSMLNRDPDAALNASSWRVTLSACLVKMEVLEWLRTTGPDYEGLDAVGLDFGYQCISRGVFTRHTPNLLPASSLHTNAPLQISIQDEIRFIRKFFGLKWTIWAVWRAAMSGYPINKLLRGWRKVENQSRAQPHNVFEHKLNRDKLASLDRNNRVTILIPTLQRYPYLRNVLRQLENQTIKPFEIIVVDQTPKDERDNALQADHAQLPLKIIYLNRSGQCISRNAGLRSARGDYILFLDDDLDDLPNDLIEKHLRTLAQHQAEVSCGVTEELGAGPLPKEFSYMRTSTVFPAGITMIKRGLLKRTGFFDPAFDYGDRADHDLGMRCYLSGALMILNPMIKVIHLKAKKGGLRKHKARLVTFADSREKIFLRQIISPTEIYLSIKYFIPRQTEEYIYLKILGTFSNRGNILKKIFKFIFSTLLLPHTIWLIYKNYGKAKSLKKQFQACVETIR